MHAINFYAASWSSFNVIATAINKNWIVANIKNLYNDNKRYPTELFNV